MCVCVCVCLHVCGGCRVCAEVAELLQEGRKEGGKEGRHIKGKEMQQQDYDK